MLRTVGGGRYRWASEIGTICLFGFCRKFEKRQCPDKFSNFRQIWVPLIGTPKNNRRDMDKFGVRGVFEWCKGKKGSQFLILFFSFLRAGLGDLIAGLAEEKRMKKNEEKRSTFLGEALRAVHAKGGRTLRKDVFLPSKHFYETLPSNNPSRTLSLLKTCRGAFKNPSKKRLPLKKLLTALLRSVLLHAPLGVHPISELCLE